MRLRAGSLFRALVGAALVIAGGADPISAQGPAGQASVVTVQGLRFGELFPGSSTRVGPDDVAQRGEVQVEGRGNYQIQFILPDALVAPSGATLPVTFVAGDGVVIRGTAGSPESFDPNLGVAVALTGGVGDAQIFLGGTASPGQAQAAGTYSATVTILLARN